MINRFLILTVILCFTFAIATGQTATQRSSHFRLVHPQTVDPRDAKYVLDLLESNCAELLQRISKAGLEVNVPNLEIVLNETTGDFTGRTGMPPWAAAATRNHHIELQPLALLKQRRILETTLRHELVHALIDTLGNGQTPRWLAEGMAVYLAGEGSMLERYRSDTLVSEDTVERLLTAPKSLAEMRTAYANAYALVRKLIQAEGESTIWKGLVQRKSRQHALKVQAPNSSAFRLLSA